MSLPLLVLGAGLSGLACARFFLRSTAQPVIILEKSRSFGGRCATRLWEGDVVDHGVLFFEESATTFTAAARTVAAPDLTPLIAPVLDTAGQPLPAVSARYTHRQGANRLARALAAGLEVRMEHLVTELRPTSEGTWEVCLADRPSLFARAVVVTAPGPQTAALLASAGVGPVELADYDPCLTAFFAYEGEGLGRTAEALARQGGPGSIVAWTVCENQKPGRIQPGHTVLVAHGSPAFSREFLEAAPSVWLPRLREEVERLWEVPERAFLREFSHRWRYARRAEASAGKSAVRPNLPPGLFLAGDNLVASSIEDVWCSGEQTAAQVAHFLQLASPV